MELLYFCIDICGVNFEFRITTPWKKKTAKKIGFETKDVK